jgi:hypothetical protein
MNGYISLFRGRPLKVYAQSAKAAQAAVQQHYHLKNPKRLVLQAIRPVKG